MLLECKVVEKISKKGEPYLVLSIDLGMCCTKDVFLTDSEKVILSLRETAENAAY